MESLVMPASEPASNRSTFVGSRSPFPVSRPLYTAYAKKSIAFPGALETLFAVFPLNKPRTPSALTMPRIEVKISRMFDGPRPSPPPAMERTATTFSGELMVREATPAMPPAKRCPHGDPSLRLSGIGKRRGPMSKPTFM